MQRIAVTLLMCVCMMSFTARPVKKQFYRGEAFDMNNSSRKLYSEEHEEMMDGTKHLGTHTIYRDSNGKAIADRQMDFTKSTLKPDFKLEDFRDGYIEGATVMADGSIKVFMKHKREDAMTEKILKVPEPCVIDGGFNYFVKTHWDEVMKGKVLSFNFVVPVEQSYYKFRIRKMKETTIRDKKVVVINLELDNFLLRTFVSPIVISYDLSNKRILEYNGISNINNSEGKSYVVKLVYPTFGP